MSTTVTMTPENRVALHCLDCQGTPAIFESPYLYSESLDNLVQAAEQHFQDVHDA